MQSVFQFKPVDRLVVPVIARTLGTENDGRATPVFAPVAPQTDNQPSHDRPHRIQPREQHEPQKRAHPPADDAPKTVDGRTGRAGRELTGNALISTLRRQRRGDDLLARADKHTPRADDFDGSAADPYRAHAQEHALVWMLVPARPRPPQRVAVAAAKHVIEALAIDDRLPLPSIQKRQEIAAKGFRVHDVRRGHLRPSRRQIFSFGLLAVTQNGDASAGGAFGDPTDVFGRERRRYDRQ